ncbi:hypothetical protein MSG28_009479 [Choristoneura fumiferana]|uniref:Uncharacterized protein n=1 Tax=Choristoneura fumiferana TaxID=7141 RepID=A0ACC0JBE0_CHOFU|nr:hypothetical protein MSG28_009479 [Choristoneura fumiferana]
MEIKTKPDSEKKASSQFHCILTKIGTVWNDNRGKPELFQPSKFALVGEIQDYDLNNKNCLCPRLGVLRTELGVPEPLLRLPQALHELITLVEHRHHKLLEIRILPRKLRTPLADTAKGTTLSLLDSELEQFFQISSKLVKFCSDYETQMCTQTDCTEQLYPDRREAIRKIEKLSRNVNVIVTVTRNGAKIAMNYLL